MIPVRIAGLVLDQRPGSATPILLLQEQLADAEASAVTVAGDAAASLIPGKLAARGRILPILVGEAEAMAIAMVLQHEKPPRPLTVDLIKLIMDALHARVARVIIATLLADTFHASLVVESEGRIFSFDARPSDSIGLALRTGAPIFVAEEVMNAAGQHPAVETAPGFGDRLRNFESADDEPPF